MKPEQTEIAALKKEVAKHRGIWPVSLTCEALDVSRSGFYAWRDRPQHLHHQ